MIVSNLKGVRWRLLFVAAAAMLVDSPAARAFDQWDVAEVFSNADGSVQFVELFTTANDQQELEFHSLDAISDGHFQTFILDHAVTNPTANHRLLFATAGFAQLTGAVGPDYQPLPAKFFDPAAQSIQIQFGHGADSITFSGSMLPIDGVHSLVDTVFGPLGQNLMTAVNSPTNFAGQTGSVNLGSGGTLAGDFDGNNVVNGADLRRWGDGFGLAAGATRAQGNADGDGDVDGADFLLWQKDFGRTATVAANAAVPEPTALAMAGVPAIGVTACSCGRRLRRRFRAAINSKQCG